MADAASATGLDVGTVIADTYLITGLLGRGGMGAVWGAEHARLPGKRVAIKVLHAEVATDQESLARFRREAEIASRLGHPNIVDVHDFNVLPDGSPYLVLEYLQGEPLDKRIKKGPIPLEQVGAIARQVGSALVAAHREQIVHRDLKPANIFLVPTETHGFVTEVTKVLDFGISKIRGSQTVKTQDSAILGTPQYMAPEQALGHHDKVDARTDVFAFGAIVYEMLSGKAAFPGVTIPEVVFKVVYEDPTPLAEIAPHVPANVATVVHKALAKNQDDRYPDAASFVTALTGTPLDTLKHAAPHGIDATINDASGAHKQTGPGSSQGSLADSLRAARPGESADVISTGGQITDGALAKTMGSGDHADAMAAETGATQAAGHAATAAQTVPEKAPAKRGPWLAVGALVVVGAAIGITVVVMGGSKDKGPDASAASGAVTVSADAAPKTTRAAVALARDAGPAVAVAASDAAVAVSAADAAPKVAVKAPPKPKKPTKHTRPAKPSKLAPEAAKLIAAARHALRAGQLEKAKHNARRANYVQPTSQAYAIMAKVACKRQDYASARARLHKVHGGLRKRVIRYCRDLGVDL